MGGAATDYGSTSIILADSLGDDLDTELDFEDPAILNLNGGAVATQNYADTTAAFDMQDNGEQAQTAWGTAGEGYLVYNPNDPSNTKAVTQASDLIGGFSELAQMDSNAGGEIRLVSIESESAGPSEVTSDNARRLTMTVL